MARLAAALSPGPLAFVPGAARARPPITIVADFGLGAGNDVAARMVAAEFAQWLASPSR